jgi:hypothetical protein
VPTSPAAKSSAARRHLFAPWPTVVACVSRDSPGRLWRSAPIVISDETSPSPNACVVPAPPFHSTRATARWAGFAQKRSPD